ncbi:uncharacterized protein LOC133849115 [Drosophila sulfurigaster albostrigata]|uniref:uncharacterized protein LOC133849115 n=1 Tax=Drosophila sulfurigaster albostrigata TaxID=89887 RepID=UPI002D21E781|nr:uncharacterized protein LOC133849115 [Drosophila sulfurigaster albostrigata]
MSSEQLFPRVLNYIGKLSIQSEDVRKLFGKLENALEEEETLCKSKDALKKDIGNLRIDLTLIRQAAIIAEEQREESNNSLKMLDNSYINLLEIVDFLGNDRMNNILRFAILSRQIEVQEELNQIELQQKIDHDCKAAMERRKIVKELRKWQQLFQDVEEENLSVKLELQQLNHHWKIKIDRATQQRNKKIISLVEMSKQITEEQTFKVPKPFAVKSTVKVKRNAPIVLQSAMEFLKNFQMKSKIAKPNEQQPLRPILVSRRSSEDDRNIQPSPTKQVHFGPMPVPSSSENSRETFESKLEEMNDDDDMVEASERSEFNLSHLPERPIIENVEVLPSLKFSFDNDNAASEVSTCSDSNNVSKSMDTLSFKNMFSSSQICDDKPSLEDLSQQSMNNFESNNVHQSNTLDFSAIKLDCNNDFFLNFDDDDCSADPQNAYDL